MFPGPTGPGGPAKGGPGGCCREWAPASVPTASQLLPLWPCSSGALRGKQAVAETLQDPPQQHCSAACRQPLLHNFLQPSCPVAPTQLKAPASGKHCCRAMPPAVTMALTSPCCTEPHELHICQLPRRTQHSQQKAAAPSPTHTMCQTNPYLAGLRAPQLLPPPLPPPPCLLAAHLEVVSSPGPQAPTRCHNTANTLMRADRPQGQACVSALVRGCHPPWAESCTFGMGSTCCSPTRLHAGRGEHRAGPTVSEQHPDHHLGHARRSRQALGPMSKAAQFWTSQLLPTPLHTRTLRIALDGQQQIKALEEL